MNINSTNIIGFLLCLIAVFVILLVWCVKGAKELNKNEEKMYDEKDKNNLK